METTIDDAVASYLEESLALTDEMASEQRDELAESIEQAVTEVAAESEGDLRQTLGDPAAFVAELIAASGFDSPARRRRRLGSANVRITTARDRLTAQPAWRWLAGLATDLRPAWWVVRAFAILWLVAELTDPSRSIAWWGPVPVPSITGPWIISAIFLGLAVLASVELGRRSWGGWRRRMVLSLNVVAAVALLTMATTVGERYDGFFGSGTAYAESPIDYPFVADGSVVVFSDGLTVPFMAHDELEHLVREFGMDGRVFVMDRDGSTIEYPDIDTYLTEHNP